MNTTYTDAGTPVLDMSEGEYHDFLDREVRARIGLSLEEFVRQVNAGKIDWEHPEAFSLAGLVGVGEGGLIQPVDDQPDVDVSRSFCRTRSVVSNLDRTNTRSDRGNQTSRRGIPNGR